MKRYYFFKLSDPRDPDKIRYIGSTTENLTIRLSKMVSEALKTDKQTEVFTWIRELFDLGMKPFIDMLEISEPTSESQANDRQTELIEKFQTVGEADLNMTKGRGTKGLSKPHEEDTKKKISETMTLELDLEKAADLRQSGLSWKNCAKEMGVAYMTLFKRKLEIEEIIANRGGLN
jgi:hypothetical protein